VTPSGRSTLPAISNPTGASDEKEELGLCVSTEGIVSIARRRRALRSRLPSPSQSALTGLNISMSSVSTGSVSNPSALSSGISSEDVYFPVPTDDTHRLGASGFRFPYPINTAAMQIAMAGLPDMGPEEVADTNKLSSLAPSGVSTKRRPPPRGEETFFGLLNGSRRMLEIAKEHESIKPTGNSISDTVDALSSDQADSAPSSLGIVTRDVALVDFPQPGSPFSQTIPPQHVSFSPTTESMKWTPHPPLRFSVSFHSLLTLSEKERSYSPTFSYAGSWWNVYVQTIRKKEKSVQLGVYLHRQNPAEPFPTASADIDEPGGGNLSNEARQPLRRANANSNHLASPSEDLPGSLAGREFTDKRRITRVSLLWLQLLRTDSASQLFLVLTGQAYFSITCYTTLGTAVIRFSSAPDSFAVSQSWGWKSSALRTGEYLGPGYNTNGEVWQDDSVLAWTGDVKDQIIEGGSLRASVVVGVV
jgi:hypothetical protein